MNSINRLANLARQNNIEPTTRRLRDDIVSEYTDMIDSLNTVEESVISKNISLLPVYKINEDKEFDDFLHNNYIKESEWKSKYRSKFIKVYNDIISKLKTFDKSLEHNEIINYPDKGLDDWDSKAMIKFMDDYKGGPNDRADGICTKALQVCQYREKALPMFKKKTIIKQLEKTITDCIPKELQDNKEKMYFWIMHRGSTFTLMAQSIIMNESYINEETEVINEGLFGFGKKLDPSFVKTCERIMDDLDKYFKGKNKGLGINNISDSKQVRCIMSVNGNDAAHEDFIDHFEKYNKDVIHSYTGCDDSGNNVHIYKTIEKDNKLILCKISPSLLFQFKLILDKDKMEENTPYTYNQVKSFASKSPTHINECTKYTISINCEQVKVSSGSGYEMYKPYDVNKAVSAANQAFGKDNIQIKANAFAFVIGFHPTVKESYIEEGYAIDLSTLKYVVESEQCTLKEAVQKIRDINYIGDTYPMYCVLPENYNESMSLESFITLNNVLNESEITPMVLNIVKESEFIEESFKEIIDRITTKKDNLKDKIQKLKNRNKSEILILSNKIKKMNDEEEIFKELSQYFPTLSDEKSGYIFIFYDQGAYNKEVAKFDQKYKFDEINRNDKICYNEVKEYVSNGTPLKSKDLIKKQIKLLKKYDTAKDYPKLSDYKGMTYIEKGKLKQSFNIANVDKSMTMLSTNVKRGEIVLRNETNLTKDQLNKITNDNSEDGKLCKEYLNAYYKHVEVCCNRDIEAMQLIIDFWSGNHDIKLKSK